MVGITRPEQVAQDVDALRVDVTRTQLELIAAAGAIDEALVGGPAFVWSFPEDRMPASVRVLLRRE